MVGGRVSGVNAVARGCILAIMFSGAERPSLITLHDLSREDVSGLLDAAAALRPLRDHTRMDALAGATVVQFFFENSTRTRLSFELAAKRLGAHVVTFDASASSVQKGETLADTIQTIDAMAPDILVMRHASSGAPEFASRFTRAAIVNAGDGARAHPTQALLDALTIRDARGSLDGVRVAIVGDVLHSRVARSNIACLSKFGAFIRVVGPRAFVPDDLTSLGVEVAHDLESGLAGVDVVYLLRIQLERQRDPMFSSGAEYHRRFGLNDCTLRFAPDHAVVMHPGPVNRGVEISRDLLEGERFLVQAQVANGVAIRMAVLSTIWKEMRCG
ncbi:MAG: aspartate carbamoyltransferase catalytic subunit [Phycisphaerales bacterium]